MFSVSRKDHVELCLDLNNGGHQSQIKEDTRKINLRR